MPSRAPHALDVEGVPAWAVVFVGPETQAGRALTARFSGPEIVDVPSDAFGEADERLFSCWQRGDEDGVVTAAQAVVDELVGGLPPTRVVDERVDRALAVVESRLDRALTLAEVAREVNLSPSRLRHLLAEQTGTGFRGHVRWRRLLRAWGLVRAGASLTETAHAAGFADSAHLSRAVRRAFGLTPSTILSALRAR